MSDQNGRAKMDPPNRNGNFTPETIAYLDRRSEAFVKMTAGKGKPVTYGQLKRDKPR